tara:strand:+ start:16832 stop:17263 length:432 start_codon:yes stop_codon:yes gene_type:complete
MVIYHIKNKKMQDKILVSVYGSLRKGLSNHKFYLKNNELLGEFKTDPIYELYDLGSFPGLKKEGYTSVTMEVYEVNHEELAHLDMLEGYRNSKDDYYIREIINTPYGKAYTYFYNHSVTNSKKVKTGDWKEHVQQLKVTGCNV